MALFRVIICGTGVAGLEGLLRLRRLAGDRVDITVLGAREDFRYRPALVGEALDGVPPPRWAVGPVVADAAANWIRDDLRAVDRRARIITTAAGSALTYDAALLAVGGREAKRVANVEVFSDHDNGLAFREILADIAAGSTSSVALLLPRGPCWPLPLYEIALLAAGRARELGVPLELSLITEDPLPLMAFGGEVGEVVADRLRRAGVTLYLGSRYRVVDRNTVRLTDGTTVHADRLVTLPTIMGPNIAGLPGEALRRFVPIDDRCRVPDSGGRLFAAGDATPNTVKHGGLAAQQADTAAAGIAWLAGVGDAPGPSHLVIRGQLLTADDPLYVQAHLVAGHGWRAQVFDTPPWSEHDKVISAELGDYLREHRFTPAAAAPTG